VISTSAGGGALWRARAFTKSSVAAESREAAPLISVLLESGSALSVC
jgi:hypothetical protein